MQLASILPALQGIMGVVSTGAGLYNSYENAQQQNKIRGILDNPTKMQNFVKGYTQPLQAGLLQGVENQAQGYAAERGLASSPAQEQQIVSQAVAPYLQQQQNQAWQEAMQALGLGLQQNQGAKGGGASLTSGLQQLMDLFQGQKNLSSIKSQAAQDQVPYQSPTDTFDPSIAYEPYQTVDLTNWAGNGGQ